MNNNSLGVAHTKSVLLVPFYRHNMPLGASTMLDHEEYKHMM